MKRPNRRRSKQASGSQAVQVAAEQVENRTLLAGVVGVSLSPDGDLTLTGDADANSIEIGNVDSDTGFIFGHVEHS